MKASLRDLREVGEALVLIVVTWFLLGWYLDQAITQLDGAFFLAPYTQSSLDAGVDWTHHAYRFGVLGGSPMHEYAGTLPLVQLCSLLGLSTTATLNIGTVFLQLCFAWFGLKLIQTSVQLSAPERLVSMWLCAFAPLLGWRLAIGHENILQGLLPIFVACALVASARAKRLTPMMLVFGFFAVFNGVSGLGAQLVIYSAVFGLPIALVVAGNPKGWTRDVAAAIATVIAGVLVALPRLSPMIAFAQSDDASRNLADSVTYAFGPAAWSDWLSSLPWTASAASGPLVHEQNYPVGPLLCFVILLRPQGTSRAIVWAVLGGGLFAVLFAADVFPISNALLTLVPPLESFRVPARAVMPVLVFIPVIALSWFWIARERARVDEPDRRNAKLIGWLAIAVAAAMIATHGVVPTIVREIVAWIACIALAVLARWRPQAMQRYAIVSILALVAAMGVLAFDERFPRDLPRDRIDNGPRQLREAALAQAPELAMPLNRVQIVGAPLPYRMGLGFAAQLSTLDGDYNPTRRFLRLLSALYRKDLPSTAVIFEIARSRPFPVLQQLYNIKYAVSFASGTASMEALPEPAGAAWFPKRIEIVDDAASIADGMSVPGALRTTAWLLRADRVTAPITCDGSVERVTTDRLGQAATIEVATTTPCTLVVATNYLSTLRATAAGKSLDVFPINIALTAVAVPDGRMTIVLAPELQVAWWARLGSIAGWLALIAALGLLLWKPRE